jgi:hypothetical protein
MQILKGAQNIKQFEFFPLRKKSIFTPFTLYMERVLNHNHPNDTKNYILHFHCVFTCVIPYTFHLLAK